MGKEIRILSERVAPWHGDHIASRVLVLKPGVAHRNSYTMMSGEIFIEAQLVDNPKSDEQSQCHTRGETSNIDKRIHLVFPEIAEGNGEEVSEHGFNFEIQEING